MKGFKILNNGFMSAFATGLACTIFEHAYSKKVHIEETLRLQKLMAMNFDMYGAHVLEEDFVLYHGLKHIVDFGAEDQPPLVELIEIEGEIEDKRKDFIKNKLFGEGNILGKGKFNIIDVNDSDLPDSLKDFFKKIIGDKFGNGDPIEETKSS